MRKEDKLILELLRRIYVKVDADKMFPNSKLLDEVEELLNPKSQEMPFKDTLEEKE